MNRIISNKLYFSSILLLCILTYLLNFCTAIHQCALVFTLIATTSNVVTFLGGKSRSLASLALVVLISFVFLGQLPYYIDGKILNGLVFASLSSLMISASLSIIVFQKLTSKFNFLISNALSCLFAALIDGFIMSLFFIINNNLAYSRVIDIFSRELSYKTLYIFIMFVIIFAFVKTAKNKAAIDYK
jgi:hypothetical protein